MIKKLGQYEVLSELGRGGMGIVLKGRDPSLDRIVAIKILSKQIVTDQTLVSRFKREAKSAASLNHPNIIQIHFIGEEDEQHYFVMEYVEGESLSHLIRRQGKLSPGLAAHILRQAASGLAAAHDKKIIHRDIKPGNIMINPEGIAKIADFGIAFVPDPEQKLTATGQFMGTPGYIPPEMCLGQPTDHRSDIFSLGIVYFEMLAGKQPFQSDSPFGLMHQMVQSELPDIRQLNSEVDPETVAILAKMVEKKPDDRYQNCHELVAALDAGPAKGGHAVIPVSIPDLDRTKPHIPTGASMEPTELITPNAGERRTAVSPPMGNRGPGATQVGAERRHTVVEAPPPPPAKAPQSEFESGSHAGVVAPPPMPRKRSKLPLVAAALFLGALFVGAFVFGPDLLDRFSGNDENGGTEQPEVIALNPEKDKASDGPVDMRGKTDGLDDPTVSEQRREGNQDGQGDDPPLDRRYAQNPYEKQGQLERNPSDGTGDSVIETGGHPLDPGNLGGGNENTTNYGANPGPIGKKGATLPVTTAEGKTKLIETPPVKVEKKRTFPPGDPNVVVVSVGDPLLAEPVELALEEFLGVDRVRLMDEDLFTELDSLVGENEVSLGPFAKSAYGLGGDVLVLAEIKFLGERDVKAVNRYSSVYTARIKVRCIQLANNRALGSAFQEQVEYNSLTATRVAEEAMRQISTEINARLKALKSSIP